MNDRYLFRGKRADNGEWVTGYYVFQRKRSGVFGQKISELDFDRHLIIDLRGNSHVVIPETVGQCTGLKDKNGKLIFEGDVVSDAGGFVYGKVVYATAQDGYDGMSGFMIDDVDNGLQEYNGFWHCVDILGNIHDNPELLQRSHEE